MMEKMTAHERCIKKLQELLRASAQKLDQLADQLPESCSPYPLSKYTLEIELMADGVVHPFPLIFITHSCWAPKDDEEAENSKTRPRG